MSRSNTMDGTYVMMDAMTKLKLTPNVPISTARVQADAILSKTVSDRGVRAFLFTNLVKKSDGG